MIKKGDEMLCPYCGNDFKRELARKTKCKKCGNFVFIRSIKGVKTAMCEKQKDEFDYVQSMSLFLKGDIDKIKDVLKKEISLAKKQLEYEYKTEPPQNDIIYRALHIFLIKAIENMNMSDIFYAKSAFLDFYCYEKKYKLALEAAFEMFALNLNGAGNWHYWDDNGNEIIEHFNEKDRGVTMIDWIKKVKDFLKLDDEFLKEKFLYVYNTKMSFLKMPLDANYALKILMENINEYR